MKKFSDLTRSDFAALKKQYVHPSSEVSQPEQLIGREEALSRMRNAFERDGANVFIWGRRGVGKTSLAHSAINHFNDIVIAGPAIACERKSSADQLLEDVLRRSKAASKSLPRIKWRLSVGHVSGEAETRGDAVTVKTINHASEILDKYVGHDQSEGRSAVVIIDEFDQLENEETVEFLTALAKQMSVDKLWVKFIFCGVAEDLESLIGSHESVGRYISAIKLDPLTDDKIWEITRQISLQFGISLGRGQEIRVGQVACGYPTFAHLIMDEVLNVAFEKRFSGNEIPQEIFNEAMRRAASTAATHLQGAYRKATQKGTDRYVEVLWAVANGPHIRNRQFKDIISDYRSIMIIRKNRYSIEKDQTFRSHLNSLCSTSNGNVLIRSSSGWYEFADPMFRGYVRMMAHNEGVELGDESFRA